MSRRGVTESVIEEAALAWLESIGWSVRNGAEITPGEPRADYARWCWRGYAMRDTGRRRPWRIGMVWDRSGAHRQQAAPRGARPPLPRRQDPLTLSFGARTACRGSGVILLAMQGAPC
jgi:hypothetical protein